MREEITVTRYSCDAPGCPVVFHEETGELPNGYHGTVVHISNLGGSANVDWFACRKAHITAAVEGALTRKYEENH